jgi:hypothetical protein
MSQMVVISRTTPLSAIEPVEQDFSLERPLIAQVILVLLVDLPASQPLTQSLTNSLTHSLPALVRVSLLGCISFVCRYFSLVEKAGRLVANTGSCKGAFIIDIMYILNPPCLVQSRPPCRIKAPALQPQNWQPNEARDVKKSEWTMARWPELRMNINKNSEAWAV